MTRFNTLKLIMTPLVIALCGGILCNATLSASEPERVDFANDVIPLLTKNGCNAGACHGAAIGRGGFKLSLYGGDPQADHTSIVRQLRGRRVNLQRPEESLLVLKPSEQVDHGGGALFDEDSESARLLTEWIRAGASDDSARTLERVDVSPKAHVFKQVGRSVPLRAVAHYSDGSMRDVTSWTIFSAEDSSAVALKRDSATPLRRGRHLVIARYLNNVVPIEMIVPLAESSVAASEPIGENFIDVEVARTLATLGLQPSPGIDDAAFLRRLTLDLTGRLPTIERTVAFLDNSDPEKRRVLVDQLLDSAEFTEYWTHQLAKLLRVRPIPNELEATRTYHQWLTEQVRGDASYRDLARALITAEGDSHQSGPPNFHRTSPNPREQAEFVSELFMGSRLRCANCHNHPLDRWTQDDYHGLAAIFAKLQRGRVIRDRPSGQTVHPRTRQPAIPKLPGMTLDPSASVSRGDLADWLTAPENPYFAKAIVNRLWKRLMGRGLVEPVDDFRDTNPATHPLLLEKLADDFIAGDYSLRHALRTIALSQAYSRGSTANEHNADDDRFYSRSLTRPLEPEVLADAISDVLGVSEAFGDQPNGTRAIALISPTTPSRTLDILGRCDRQESCESTLPTVSGLTQKLHLLNGDLLNARIAADGSRLSKLRNDGTTHSEIVETFYLAALARRPNTLEAKYWSDEIAAADDPQDFLEDFVWGLMTSREFMTNH
ncbi:MAG: DUF1549 domain-containing protein [Planctomycetota bacterium]